MKLYRKPAGNISNIIMMEFNEQHFYVRKQSYKYYN